MKRVYFLGAANLFAALLLVACGASAPRPVAEIDPLPSADDSAATITPAAGVTLAVVACLEGAEERCDAVDDDCDGVVDEGCDLTSGAGQLGVVVAWNTDARLTASIEGPGFSPSTTSACGAGPRLHAEALAEASGQYRVGVTLMDACGVEGPTTALVTVTGSGHVLGSYQVTVAEGLTPVATLTLPSPGEPSSPAL